AGSPSALCGLLCLGLWSVLRMLPSTGPARGFQPVRIALAIYVVAILASYAWGHLHPLGGDELSGADRGLLTVASWAGTALVIALIAMIQFSTGFDPTAFIRIPGLTVNGTPQSIQTGGALRRVTGTASHPIEFGMVLALVLPFALHYALGATTRKRLWWAMTIVIAMVLPTSLSRSAILALAVELMVLFVRWEPRRRLAALAALPVFIVGLRVTSPGLVGTIISMFAGAKEDPSLQGRA